MLQAGEAAARREVVTEIDAALERVVAATGFLEDRGQDRDAAIPPALCDAVRDFLLVGRGRVRPRLLVEMHDSVAVDGAEPLVDRVAVLDAAASVELLHLFTLVHDDIVDASEERDGRPTLRVAAAEHGDGDSIALVLGDLIFARAMQVLALMPAPAELVRAAMHVFTTESLSAGGGQLDELIDGEALPWRAARSGRQKTAPQGFRLPLELGALLCGAGPAALHALGRAGDDLGGAYQLADDLVELAAAAASGCSWSDASQGVPALVIAIALARLDSLQRHRLDGLLGRADLSETEERSRVELVLSSGAVECTGQRIELLLARACARVRNDRDLPATAVVPLTRVARRIRSSVEDALAIIRRRRP